MDSAGAVAIAGATGFVGRALAGALAGRRRVIGLARNPPGPALEPAIEWRPCDLFSLLQCEEALRGVEQAVYLVHSMLPSAHLTQGAFQDFDLICADNFARAAAQAGVRQIVYLGGLIPDDPELSAHLRSRLEVEQTLASQGVPVTALRASIIIGPGGSSYRMFRSLIERLPFIPCPPWAGSLTQPIALDDVLALLVHCLEHPASRSRSWDIGSADVMTYRQLLERTAGLLGLKRRFFSVPVPGTFWCRSWLGLMSGAPQALVAPLVESIRHSMVCRDRRLQEEAGVPGIPFDTAVRAAAARRHVLIRLGRAPRPLRHAPWRELYRYDVRSVQRMGLPPGRTARWAAEQYGAFLARRFRWVLRADVNPGRSVRFRLAGLRLCLVELTFAQDRSQSDSRQVFYITGGALVRRVQRATGRPRLEFRQVLGGRTLLVGIHDYRPALPWPLYSLTQARIHLRAMRAFARYLAGLQPPGE
ncbi:MAG: NAD(P)H-binding protein [Elusimicrobia bacterium]|nr:NAD(P)H-binding protein [Elusimicrobiota bacterium]